MSPPPGTPVKVRQVIIRYQGRDLTKIKEGTIVRPTTDLKYFIVQMRSGHQIHVLPEDIIE